MIWLDFIRKFQVFQYIFKLVNLSVECIGVYWVCTLYPNYLILSVRRHERYLCMDLLLVGFLLTSIDNLFIYPLIFIHHSYDSYNISL